jgi:diguanylate cyclase (GGDEF)-like protein/PAS domain S-box-containing protein
VGSPETTGERRKGAAGERARRVRGRRERSLKDPWTLAEFIRNVQEGIYITTAEGKILDANPAFLRMFGVSSLQALGEYTAEQLLMKPELRREELATITKNGAVRDFEMEIRRPDGEVRTVLDTAYQVKDPDTGETLYHGILIDITERTQLEQQLLRAALRDPLTGCFNRRFLSDMERALDPQEQGWGTIVIDIDNFKDYNDRYGHHIGDRVLMRVARFLLSLVRAEDAVIRIGGDEFLLLLIGATPEATAEVAHRLRKTGPGAVPVSVSVGSAVRRPAESLEDTIRRADRQLIQIRVRERQPRSRRLGGRRLPPV